MNAASNPKPSPDESSISSVDPRPSGTGEDVDWKMVARVEVDRFCEQCGFNLYTQPVGLHPEWNLLLVRCPDCGHIHSAREHSSAWSVWVRRFSVPLLILWLACILAVLALSVVPQVGMNFRTIDEARTSERHEVIRKDGSRVMVYSRTLNAGYPSDPQDVLMVRVFRLLFAGLGFVVISFATVVVPHWRRWGYMLFAVLIASIAPLCMWIYLSQEFSGGLGRGMTLSLVYAGFFFSFSVVAAFVGRPLARGLIRIALPPRMRVPFAYLWTVDGKPMPSIVMKADR